MSLIRFHNWIVDKNDISFVEIISEDGKTHNEFDEANHNVILKLKNDQTFTLSCHNLYSAQRELNFLTIENRIPNLTDEFNHCLIQQIYHARDSVVNLEREIKKLMKSYKKIKGKK